MDGSSHGEMSDEKRKMRMEWRNHAAMRTLAAVIVVVFVFWCGFEFGEIRASVGMNMMQGGWSEMGGGMRMHTMMPVTGTAVPTTGPTTAPAAQ